MPLQLDREAWLTEAADYLLDDVVLPAAERVGRPTPRPPIRVSVGFPTGRASRKQLAACYRRAASADGHNEIFVSPTSDDSQDILASLTHELIHACDDCASGHRNYFAAVARACDLQGPLTATTAGPSLSHTLAEIVDTLGAIPHARLDVTQNRQKGRYHKLQCAACGFTCRTSDRWLRQLHNPAVCPVCLQHRLSRA